MIAFNPTVECYGTIIFGEEETIVFPIPDNPNHTITKTPGEWKPDKRFVPFLPEDFSLKFDCYVDSKGIRHIVFRYSYEELIDVGAVGGIPFLLDQCGLEDGEARLYSDLLLAHQRVRGREYDGRRGAHSHFNRKLKYSRDLYLRRICRPASDERNILPITIGWDKHGMGKKLTIRQLIEDGRQAIVNKNGSPPISRQSIPAGFHQAAIKNPLELDGEKVLALILRALYDFDSSNIPPETVVRFVRERLAAAIDSHRNDSLDDFFDWFAGKKNSLAKRIAKQKKKPGGVLTNTEVHQSLLVLTIRAYEWMARCIDALMKAVKNSMPVPLNAQERTLFEHMYESQPYYGGFPAALIAERMDFLKPAILAIWNEPENENHKYVLYRMLEYYAEMVRKRLEADRRPKRTGGKPQQLIENLHGEVWPAERMPFDLIGDHFREVLNITCDSGCLEWQSRHVNRTKDTVTIGIRCECGNSDHELEIPIEDFIVCGKDIL